jgi:hypothetical protein
MFSHQAGSFGLVASAFTATGRGPPAAQRFIETAIPLSVGTWIGWISPYMQPLAEPSNFLVCLWSPIRSGSFGHDNRRHLHPLYARVSAKLKERIASGEFGSGARLPP